MTWRKNCLFILFTLILQPVLNAQVVYEPLHRDIYPYLSRLAQKRIITLNDRIKPLSRMYLAKKLRELSEKQDQLTPLERQELTFLQKDFFVELSKLADKKPTQKFRYLKKDAGERFRFASYHDSLFSLNGSLIYGMASGTIDGETHTHRWNGVYLHGYLTDFLGYSFDFRDNREDGVNADRTKTFTPETGVVTQQRIEGTAFEYSEAHTVIGTGWKWGSASIGKDFMRWGHGESGQLVLSQKAPSFPFIRLDIQPASWLRFNYFHGWLLSNVVDSSGIYQTLNPGQNRIQFREKYLASHTLSLTPWQGLDFAIGESIVYSDQLELSYLMPLMFFRLADHYLSDRRNSAGNNAQLFFAVSSRGHIPNAHFYNELFIDDLSIGNVFNADKAINYFGWTNGLSVTDFPLNNLTATLEYTRVNPFAYSHFVQTQTYQNNGYNLGHWIGYNRDLFYGALHYRLRRGLQTKVWGQYIREGGRGTLAQQYTLPHPQFLFGKRTNYMYWGGEVKYEILHELFIKAYFQTMKTSSQREDGNFLNVRKDAFSLSVYYGL